jgi:hypothetical protein
MHWCLAYRRLSVSGCFVSPVHTIVRVLVQDKSVCTCEESAPRGDTGEAFMDDNVRALSGTNACDAADSLVGLVVAAGLARQPSPLQDSQGCENLLADDSRLNLVDDTQPDCQSSLPRHLQRHDISVLGLRNELGKAAKSFERTLSIGDAHNTGHPIDASRLSTVVPSVLRARQGVQIEFNPDTVLSAPRNGLQEVSKLSGMGPGE